MIVPGPRPIPFLILMTLVAAAGGYRSAGREGDSGAATRSAQAVATPDAARGPDPAWSIDGCWAITGLETSIQSSTGEVGRLYVQTYLDIEGSRVALQDMCPPSSKPIAVEPHAIEPDGRRLRRFPSFPPVRSGIVTLTGPGQALIEIEMEGLVGATIRFTLVRGASARQWRATCFSPEGVITRQARCPDGWQSYYDDGIRWMRTER